MKTISSFFTNNGSPATGLSPTIRVWDVTSGTNTLIVTDAAMTEVGDGFYTYDFGAYDPQNDYLFRTDGGVSLPAGERYQKTSNSNDADEIWGANSSDYVDTGTTGLQLNQVSADVQQLRVDVTTAVSIVDELLKYECNRTLVDPNTNTLTIFDDDGTTPLKVFNLLDENGNPSSDCVFERDPV